MPELTISVSHHSAPDFVSLSARLDAELEKRYPGLTDDDPTILDDLVVCVVARVGGEPIGCGALRELEPGVAQIKRMFVSPRARRCGAARQILVALEEQALARGYSAVRLGTGVRQPEATALYESCGFQRIDSFGEYAGTDQCVCYERRLGMLVRHERMEDFAAIREINIAAFRDHTFSQQTEHLIVEALRAAGALELSLVAVDEGVAVGHVAFSFANIGDVSEGWYLLGPIAVQPDRQGEGIGRALVEAGLDELRARDASGCVLVGDPAFYSRFGFGKVEGVTCEGVPDENVLCLGFGAEQPTGELTYHDAFSVTG